MKETYLTAEQITKALRISKEKVSLLAKQGLFPKPLKLHTGAVLWSEKEVKDWVGMKHSIPDTHTIDKMTHHRPLQKIL